MKRIVSLLAPAILFVLMAFSVSGDECNTWYPMKVGETRTYTQYDAKDKVTGSSTQKVIAARSLEGGLSVTMGVETKSKDADTAISGQFTVTCQNGQYSVSMDNMLDPKLLAAYEGMEVVIDADQMELPTNITVGQKLKDASITAKVLSNGMSMFSITINVTNRTIAAMEDVTTSAGTFSCYRLNYDVESKVAFIKTKATGSEWYAKKTGLVKTATYDKKGKLEAYTLLTAISR
jgi:hypothetical protein